MIRRGGPGARRRGRGAAAALLAVVLHASCSSSPPPAAKPASVPTPAPVAASPAPAELPAGPGTALKTAAPSDLSKAHDERVAIDEAIVMGIPSSLIMARALIAVSKTLKPEEASALASISRGIEALLYPPFDDEGRLIPPAITEPSLPGAGSAGPGNAGTILKLLGEAAKGIASNVPPEIAGEALGELVPALALIAASSSDAMRRAVDALDRFARIGTPTILVDYLRGLDAERRSAWATAAPLYAAALAKAPEAWPAGLGSGRCLLTLGRAEEALAALSPLAESRSGSADFDRPYAIALYANGRFEEAGAYVARVLIRDPQDSNLVLIRAHLLVRARSYQQALPLLDAYGTVDSGRRLFLLLRCLAAEGLRSRDEALRWARRGLAAFPSDPEILVATARLLFAGPASGKEEARTIAQRAFDLTAGPAPAPQAEAAATGLGADLASSPVLAAARAAAGAEAARLLVVDAASRFRWEEAATYLERGLGVGAFEDKALAAAILRKAKRRDASLAYAAAWYREKPDSDAAAEAYLRALIDAGNEGAAQELIARVLQRTSVVTFRSTLYYLQSRLQKTDEAAQSLLRSALIENADNPEALAAFYDIHMRRKDYAKARFYLKQALALAPGDPDLERRQRELDAAAPQ